MRRNAYPSIPNILINRTLSVCRSSSTFFFVVLAFRFNR